MKLKWLVIFGALLVLPMMAQADCAWVVGDTCNNLAGCKKATQESFCNNASNKDGKDNIVMAECCCCEEARGCCEYYNRKAQKLQAGYYDRAKCYGFEFFANVKSFTVNGIVEANQKTGESKCVLPENPNDGCCECSADIMSGGNVDRVYVYYADPNKEACKGRCSSNWAFFPDRKVNKNKDGCEPKVLSTTGCCACTTFFDVAVINYFSTVNEKACSDSCSAGTSVFYENQKVNTAGDGCEDKALGQAAQPGNSGQNNAPSVAGNTTGSATEYKLLYNPLGTTEIPVLVGRLITTLINIIGAIALLVMVYGGWLWLTAMGDKAKISQGFKLIIWSAIGLVIIFLGYVIVKFVFDVIGAKMPTL